jgi:hypothetical protein
MSTPKQSKTPLSPLEEQVLDQMILDLLETAPYLKGLSRDLDEESRRKCARTYAIKDLTRFKRVLGWLDLTVQPIEAQRISQLSILSSLVAYYTECDATGEGECPGPRDVLDDALARFDNLKREARPIVVGAVDTWEEWWEQGGAEESGNDPRLTEIYNDSQMVNLAAITENHKREQKWLEKWREEDAKQGEEEES